MVVTVVEVVFLELVLLEAVALEAAAVVLQVILAAAVVQVKVGQLMVQHTLAVVEEHHKEAAPEAVVLAEAVAAHLVLVELLEMELMD
jgi:hypothetical protein